MPNFVPNFIKKSMKRLHFLIILSFITIFSSAEPFCDVRKFSILDGLAANSISDLAQGYDNMMWFGTLNGLSYYDGYHFKTFRDEPDDIDIMSTNRILAIFPSPDNNVWVVTFDRKLYIFDTEQCQFIKVGTMLCQRFGIHLESSQIYPLANGHTWITTHKQNFLIRVGQGKDIESMKPELIKVGEKRTAKRQRMVYQARQARPRVDSHRQGNIHLRQELPYLYALQVVQRSGQHHLPRHD